MDPGPRTCHSGPLPLRYTLRPLNPLLKSTKMVGEDGSGRSQREVNVIKTHGRKISKN